MLNRKPARKETVINEGRQSEIVSDAELARVAELQGMAWNAHSIASEAALAIERKLGYGARIVSDKWIWDADLKMVRSKKVAGAG